MVDETVMARKSVRDELLEAKAGMAVVLDAWASIVV